MNLSNCVNCNIHVIFVRKREKIIKNKRLCIKEQRLKKLKSPLPPLPSTPFPLAIHPTIQIKFIQIAIHVGINIKALKKNIGKVIQKWCEIPKAYLLPTP